MIVVVAWVMNRNEWSRIYVYLALQKGEVWLGCQQALGLHGSCSKSRLSLTLRRNQLRQDETVLCSYNNVESILELTASSLEVLTRPVPTMRTLCPTLNPSQGPPSSLRISLPPSSLPHFIIATKLSRTYAPNFGHEAKS